MICDLNAMVQQDLSSGGFNQLLQCQVNVAYLAERVQAMEKVCSQFSKRDFQKLLPIIQEEEINEVLGHDRSKCGNHSLKELKKK